MPVYLTPKLGDCSSYNSLDCAESYKHGALLSEEEEFVRPEIPPEETEDYIEAKARYEAHIQMMGEALTVFDELYWKRLYHGMKQSVFLWSQMLNGKLLVLGKELAGCFLSGAIFIGALCVMMSILGPIRLKTFGVLIVGFVIGSICITESTEIASSALIGMTLVLFIFFAKMQAGDRVLQVKNRSRKNKLPVDDSVYVFIDFWYMGHRSVWINLTQRVIGIL